jgi:peptide/nickel transport system ATP-binding protein
VSNNQTAGKVALSLRDIVIARAGHGSTIIRIPDVDVAAGEAVAVMAPSGTGKTLLLKAIAGILPEEIKVRSGGSIVIEGVTPAGRKTLSRSVSYIPQNALNAWAPGIRIEKQVHRALKGIDFTMRELLERVALQEQEVIGKYPHQLSGGMCQRLLVAVAAKRQPGIILADEPLSSTDRLSGTKVMEVFTQEMRRGAAIVMTTHNQGQADTLCHQCIALGDRYAQG